MLRPGEYVATLNGLKIRYRIAGEGPVLMVQPPGWGVGAALYEATFRPLEKDFTLVYHDPRGSGGSEMPADEGTLQVGQYVEDLEALRRHLGIERFALIGHSHGGLIALHYAARHPGRVTHLLPLAAQIIGPLDDPGDVGDIVAELSRDPAFERGLHELHRAGEAIMGSPSDEAFTRFLAGMAPIYFKDQRHARLLTDFLAEHTLSARTVRETSMRDPEFPVTEVARGIRAATLVLAGRYDILCPAWAQRALAGRIPGAKLAVFERSAHFPWVEEPAGFFAAVHEFLAPRATARQ